MLTVQFVLRLSCNILAAYSTTNNKRKGLYKYMQTMPPNGLQHFKCDISPKPFKIKIYCSRVRLSGCEFTSNGAQMILNFCQRRIKVRAL